MIPDKEKYRDLSYYELLETLDNIEMFVINNESEIKKVGKKLPKSYRRELAFCEDYQAKSWIK